MSLTARGRAFLAAAVLCYFVGVVGRLPFLAFAAILLVALVAVGVLLLILAPPRVTVSRTVTPSVVEAGHTLRVVVELSGPRVTHNLEWTDGEIRGAGERGEYVLHPRRRGTLAIGPLVVFAHDPFGLVRSAHPVGELTPALVTPRLEPLDQVLETGLDPSGDEPVASRMAGAGQDDVVARPYAPGDGIRRLHWKATARRGQPMVRQEEQRDHPRVLVALDTSALAHETEPDRDGWTDSLVFERSVSRAASLVRGLSAAGYDVDLRAGEDLHVVTPGGGLSGHADLPAQRALAEVEPSVRPDRRLLTGDRDRAAALVVTGHVDTAAARDLVSAFASFDRVRVLLAGSSPAARDVLAEAGWDVS